MDYIELGKRIKNERKKLGLTQQKIADISGLSMYFIGNIERGERKLSLDALVKIANTLHVSYDYLLEGIRVQKKEIPQNELEFLISKCTKKEREQITEMLKAIVPRLKTYE